jgi:hypothetical protein
MNGRSKAALWALVVLALAGCGGGGNGGANTGDSVRLTMTRLPDNSGQIGIASGWRLTAGANGAASAAGPNGAQLNVGIPVSVVTRGVEFLFPDIPPAALFPGSPRVDFTNAVRAYLDLVAQQPGARITAVRTVEFVAMEGGSAAYVRVAGTNNGAAFEQFALVQVRAIDNVQGLVFISEVSGPPATFAQQFPAMLAMWNSWSLNPATIQGRLSAAAKALAEVDVLGTIDSVLQERRLVAQQAARAWDAYIRQ